MKKRTRVKRYPNGAVVKQQTEHEMYVSLFGRGPNKPAKVRSSGSIFREVTGK